MAKATDKLPPHSAEAELGVLGCVLLAPADTLATLTEQRITEEHFYDLRHRTVFGHMRALAEKGAGVDVLGLQIRLRDAGALEDVGGIAFLNGLADAAPSAANLSYYLDTLTEKFLRRRLVQTCTQVATQAHTAETDVEVLMDAVEREVVGLCESRAPSQAVGIKEILVNEVIPETEEHYTRGSVNLPPGHLSTGFDYFDKVSGGFGPQDYVVLAGRPGGGKTALAMNIAEHHALAGLPVGVFSLEMSRKSLARRMMFKGARVSMGKFRQGFASKDDFQSLINAAARLSAAPSTSMPSRVNPSGRSRPRRGRCTGSMASSCSCWITCNWCCRTSGAVASTGCRS